MVQHIADVTIDVTKPGSDTPAFAIPAEDIGTITLDETAQDAMDGGDVELENTDASYTGARRITPGDRLDIYVQLEDGQSLSHWLTAMARDVTDTLEGGTRQALGVELTDFVFSVLSFRTVDAAFEAEDAGAIVDGLVAGAAPELDRSQIQTLGVDTDIIAQGRTLLDVIVEDIAPIGDAVLGHDKTSLVVKPLQDVNSAMTLTPSDLHAPVEVTAVDDNIANRARVDGGVDHAVDSEQLTQSATARVTETDRIVEQIPVRKSEVARVAIHTEPDPNSSDAVVVRLQADRDGSPVDVDDRESDLARRTLADDFLADGALTEFRLPDHTLAPRENPHLIIEADGPDGHDIGTDGNATPTYRAEYPYPLIAEGTDGDSQAEYRRRDVRIRDEQLDTLQAVQDKTQSVIRHRAQPARRISGGAATPAAHQLSPGDAVDVAGFPELNINGRQYLVTERSTELSGTLLRTGLTLQDIRTI